MIRICISTLKTEKLFWSFCLEIRNLVHSCCYAVVEYTCRFTGDIEDYRSADPVLSTLQKADRDSLRKIWFLWSTQHFFHRLVPNSLYTENGQEMQAVWGENERDKDPFPSLIPPLFWSTAPGVDDWGRVSFQLSLSTMILNKCINAILTINCSQAFDNTIHFVMKKKRKKKKEERRVLRLLHLELSKRNYFSCRSSGT